MKHGSLFSGIGGIDLGFEMAGIETTWTCEIDDWANELLQSRFPKANHYRDVQKIGKDNLESVDIISGGFPCQDISTAGKGAGLDGKRSGLWFEMWRIICELRPRWVLIENVANLANKGGSRVLHDLAKAGYDAEWQVISARDVGGRHLRKRLWIIAYRQDISNSLCERFQGQLYSPKGKDRNAVRGEWTNQSSIQGRDTKLSNPNSNRCEDTPFAIEKDSKNSSRKKHIQRDNSSKSSGNVSRANGGGEKGISKRKNQEVRKFKIETFEILKNEPRLDRVAYGLSQKLDRYNDRVKGLGNAVVPQIPYQIGKRIIMLNNLLEK
ncbi:DNA (cytosine-5-)-methyltransferase (TIGR00675) [uncultured Mediterranean phage uvMED]|nr:DNA (cytosine-5-)-methyltransferase (TIGR00675) [uncultured Mediterranean phage uvMED]